MEIPFIMFSGKAGRKTAMNALELGADYFVLKSDDPKDQYRSLVKKLEKVEKRESGSARKDLKSSSKATVASFMEDLDLSPKLVVGLLNSYLLQFWLKFDPDRKIGGRGKKRGQSLSEFVLDRLSQDNLDIVGNKVARIKNYQELKSRFESIWKDKAEELKNSERPLLEILLKDKKFIERGKPELACTKNFSFSDNQERKELLERYYPEFVFHGGSKNNVIVIYGVEGGKEEMLFKMGFRFRPMMQAVYLSIRSLFDSPGTVGDLYTILSETRVPLIQTSPWRNRPVSGMQRDTDFIQEEAGKRFKEWNEVEEKILKWQGSENLELDVEPDIVKIENKIQGMWNEINAYIFSLYGIDKREVKEVMDTLKVRKSIQRDVLSKYDLYR